MCVCYLVRCHSFMMWCRSGMPCPLPYLRWCSGLLRSRSCTSKVTHRKGEWFTVFQTCFVSLYQVSKLHGKGTGERNGCNITLTHIWMHCCWLINSTCRYCNKPALGGWFYPSTDYNRENSSSLLLFFHMGKEPWNDTQESSRRGCM